MFRAMAAAGALALGLTFAGVAGAQPMLSDWSVPEMRAALVAAGGTVLSDGKLDDGNPYISAKSPGGLKFTVSGRVCSGGAAAKRCKGALIETRFNLDSEAQVESWIKQLDYAAVSISNGGDSDLLLSRYLIFDHGIHPENLQINISVFTGVAEEVWSKL